MTTNVLKLFLFVLILPSLGFIAWMNLTPGYFQYGGCSCAVKYITDAQAQEERQSPICAVVGICAPRIWYKPLLFLAKLDFNRGGKEVKDSAPSQFCGGSPFLPCPQGYSCQVKDPKAKPTSPDSLGTCQKINPGTSLPQPNPSDVVCAVGYSSCTDSGGRLTCCKDTAAN